MKKVLLSLVLVLTLVMSSICCVNAAAVNDLELFRDQFFKPDDAITISNAFSVNVPVAIKVKLNSAPATSYASSLTANTGATVDVIAELDMTNVKALVEAGVLKIGDYYNTIKNRAVSGQFVINAGWNNVLEVAPGSLTTGGMTGFKFYDGSGTEIQNQDIFVENAPRVESISNGNVVGVKSTISVKSGLTIDDISGKPGAAGELPKKITLEYSGLQVVNYGNITGSFDIANYNDAAPTIEAKSYTKLNFNEGDRYVKYDFVVTPATVNNASSSVSGGGSSSGAKIYTLTYDSNGGTEYKAETHTEGKTVILDKVPEKDGYIFDGWYADKELTKKIDSIKMTDAVTVYAAWKLVEGDEPVEVHPVPEMLNGEDHFAYINGYTDGTIRPETNITRAEVATIFFRLLKDEVRDKYLTKENVFVDVNEGDWFNTAISTMANAGVVNGRYADEFVPDEYITRAEFTTICARFDETNTMSENKFSDISFHWAEKYILEAVSYGWITGYEDYTFRPDVFITRAEAVTLINRVVNRNPKTVDAMLDDMKVWTDNSDESAWYYIAIQEAANSHEYAREDGVYETWTQLTENRDWTVFEK